jgi:hypothetical protein
MRGFNTTAVDTKFNNTEQGTISGDTGSTGNKGYIGAKGPSINTDQGKMSGDKVSTGNKGFIADYRPSIHTKEDKVNIPCYVVMGRRLSPI